MRMIPKEMLPKASIQRVIAHWTAGTHKASENDREHYHFLFEVDGKLIRGIPPITGNSSAGKKGKTASHTLNCNTGSAGVSLCCMGGAIESPFNSGKWPMSERQWDAMILGIADICETYSIRVSPKTVLSHAEVQSNLNIRQRGKWDFTRLSFDPTIKGAKACGDKMRAEVQAALDGRAIRLANAEIDEEDGEPMEPIPTIGGGVAETPAWVQNSEQAKLDRVVLNAQKDVKGDPQIFSIQSRLKARNYPPGLLDGIWGGKTREAIAGFTNDRGLPILVPINVEEFRTVYRDLADALSQAEAEKWFRPVTQERKEADPETVAKIAPESVPQKQTFLGSLWATIAGFLALIFEQVRGFFSSAFSLWNDNKDALPQDKGILQTLFEPILNLPRSFWIFGIVAVFGVLAFNAYRGLKITTDQVRTGER